MFRLKLILLEPWIVSFISLKIMTILLILFLLNWNKTIFGGQFKLKDINCSTENDNAIGSSFNVVRQKYNAIVIE